MLERVRLSLLHVRLVTNKHAAGYAMTETVRPDVRDAADEHLG
ncbi:hypothetical protein [Pseudokineococcus basanitobsidens]